MRRYLNRLAAFPIATAIGSTLCFQVGIAGWQPCDPQQETLASPPLPSFELEPFLTCGYGEANFGLSFESDLDQAVELRMSNLPRVVLPRPVPD